jgi:hypothetical protein
MTLSGLGLKYYPLRLKRKQKVHYKIIYIYHSIVTTMQSDYIRNREGRKGIKIGKEEIKYVFFYKLLYDMRKTEELETTALTSKAFS